MHVQVKEAQKTSSSGTDGRMFATQPCLFQDEHHVGWQPTSLMTVIVEAAQVEKNGEETTKQRALITRTCAAGLLLSAVRNRGRSNVMKSDAHCCAYLEDVIN